MKQVATRGVNRKPLRMLQRDVGHSLKGASPLEFTLTMIDVATGELTRRLPVA